MTEETLIKANEIHDRIWLQRRRLSFLNDNYEEAFLAINDAKVVISDMRCWPDVINMVRKELETKLADLEKQFTEYQ